MLPSTPLPVPGFGRDRWLVEVIRARAGESAPRFPTDQLRRKAGAAAPPPEAPVVLMGREGNRRVVSAADVAAKAAGLRPGAPVTKAQVLVPGLIVQDADPSADAEAA